MTAWLIAKLEQLVANKLISYLVLQAKNIYRIFIRNLDQKKELKEYEKSVDSNASHAEKMKNAEELLNSGSPKH